MIDNRLSAIGTIKLWLFDAREVFDAGREMRYDTEFRKFISKPLGFWVYKTPRR